MKKFIALCFIIICIVMVVAWFVNRSINFINITSLTNSGEKIYNEITNKNSSWQFAVIGDTEQIPPITQKIIADLQKRDLAFLIHVGDITSKGELGGIQKTKDLFDALPYPVYFIPGNNDLVYDESTQHKTLENYKKVMGENIYQSFDMNSVHIVLLDNSYMVTGFSDEELSWLKTDLDKNDQTYTFLFFHRPLNVPGQSLFGDDETAASRIQNEKFISLIKNYDITRIFNGHLHISLSYKLNDIPVTITGGGGAEPQPILGGSQSAFYHYQLVTIYSSTNEDEKIEPSIEIISFNE